MKTSTKKLIVTLLIASFVCTISGCSSGGTTTTENSFDSSSDNLLKSSDTEISNSEEAGIEDFDFDFADDEKSYKVRSGYTTDVVNFMEGEGVSFYNIPSEYNGLPVVEIAINGFAMHNNAKEIIIPDSVVEIGSQAFAFCENLEKIEFGKGIEKLGSDVFQNDTALKKVELDCKVTEIPVLAFSYCTSLETVTLGESVTFIDESAFQMCSSLKELHVTDSLTKIADEGIDDSVFSGCDNLTIYAPAGSYAETYAKEKGINFVAE